MATWTFEQATAGNSNSVAFPSNVKAGSLLFVVAGGDSGTTISAPTDTRGNTYTQIRNLNDATNGIRAVTWYAVANGAGANTVTFTNVGSFDFYAVGEWSVDVGTPVLDVETGQVAAHTSATDNITSGSVTTGADGELIVGLAAEDTTNNTYSAGTGFTSRATTTLEGISTAPVVLESKTLATAGSAAATFTGSSTGNALAMVAAFKVSTPGIAHDAVSESDTGTSGVASVASFNWTHTPVGTPAGVLVFVRSNGTDPTTGVTYGGSALTKITGGVAVDSAGEPGTIQAWYLGASVPTGAQSVVVSRTNNSVNTYAVAITVTSANGSDTEVYEAGIQIVQGDGTLAEVNVDDGSPGTDSLRYAGLSSGLSSPTGLAGPNSTGLISIDFGATVSYFACETTAGQGSRPVGMVSATSDDRALVALAVREAAGATVQNLAAALDITPAIATALTREAFLVSAIDISPAIATAFTREAFLASAFDISPAVDVALIREAFLSSAADISPTIDTALTREQFFAVTDAIGLAISTSIAATDELLLSSSIDVSPSISTALLQEQFLTASFDIALTIDDSLTREAFLAAALDISPLIDTTIAGGTGVSLHNRLTLGVG